VRFLDDDYRAAAVPLSRFERIGGAGADRAATWLSELGSLAPIQGPSSDTSRQRERRAMSERFKSGLRSVVRTCTSKMACSLRSKMLPVLGAERMGELLAKSSRRLALVAMEYREAKRSRWHRDHGRFKAATVTSRSARRSGISEQVRARSATGSSGKRLSSEAA